MVAMPPDFGVHRIRLQIEFARSGNSAVFHENLVNRAGSVSGLKTPVRADLTNTEKATVPVVPLAKRTDKRNASNGATSTTRHGMRGRMPISFAPIACYADGTLYSTRRLSAQLVFLQKFENLRPQFCPLWVGEAMLPSWHSDEFRLVTCLLQRLRQLYAMFVGDRLVGIAM